MESCPLQQDDTIVRGLAARVLAAPNWANGLWQIVQDTPAEIISTKRAYLQHSATRVSFRERHVFRVCQSDPGSLRPVREILVKHMADCPGRCIAALLRAVFPDGDPMISYRAGSRFMANSTSWTRMAWRSSLCAGLYEGPPRAGRKMAWLA